VTAAPDQPSIEDSEAITAQIAAQSPSDMNNVSISEARVDSRTLATLAASAEDDHGS